MAKECKKCGNNIPCKIKIGGKVRNLNNRTYCLDCSPFGQHNTRQLDKYNEFVNGKCYTCSRKLDYKGTYCWYCNLLKRETQRSDKVYAIVGEQCWLCEYDVGREMLDFHHMEPDDKEFCVNKRSIGTLGWQRVLDEMEKCAVVCCRCHREIEYGYIPTQKVQKVYETKWKRIRRRSTNGCTLLS